MIKINTMKSQNNGFKKQSQKNNKTKIKIKCICYFIPENY